MYYYVQASVVHIGNKTENDYGRRWKFEHVLWSDIEHSSTTPHGLTIYQSEFFAYVLLCIT